MAKTLSVLCRTYAESCVRTRAAAGGSVQVVASRCVHGEARQPRDNTSAAKVRGQGAGVAADGRLRLLRVVRELAELRADRQTRPLLEPGEDACHGWRTGDVMAARCPPLPARERKTRGGGRLDQARVRGQEAVQPRGGMGDNGGWAVWSWERARRRRGK